MSSSKQFEEKSGAALSRRALVGAAGVTAAAIVTSRAFAQQPPAAPGGAVTPPSTVTTPPRDFGPNAPPYVYFTDPDVITVDPSFNALRTFVAWNRFSMATHSGRQRAITSASSR